MCFLCKNTCKYMASHLFSLRVKLRWPPKGQNAERFHHLHGIYFHPITSRKKKAILIQSHDPSKLNMPSAMFLHFNIIISKRLMGNYRFPQFEHWPNLLFTKISFAALYLVWYHIINELNNHQKLNMAVVHITYPTWKQVCHKFTRASKINHPRIN